MKKVLSIALAVVMLFCFAGCGQSKEFPGDTMELSEMMTKITEGVSDLPECQTMELNDEIFEMCAFIEPIEGAEGIVSEALMNVIPHSVVLIRVPEGTNAGDTAALIKENADPRKWVCVQAENTTVTYHGNTILLVLSSTATAEAIAANFDALWK